MDRVIVWHRWSPTAEPSREAVSLGAHWRAAARDRFHQVQATVLSELGGSAVFALETSQLLRAVELCLTAVREAEREDSGAGGLSCGIAVGSVERERSEGEPAGAFYGDVIDRAQALAHAAGTHDIVLDAAAQAAASATFLFAREVATSAGLGGAVLDRAFARRSD
ncbi:MAG: hypothetical protein JWN04_3556, partial [Myxococcaceae bacterium]|nr:hypothetical protein [Myxococcaceae bacterium]